jgi:hypothetical protein
MTQDSAPQVHDLMLELYEWIHWEHFSLSSEYHAETPRYIYWRMVRKFLCRAAFMQELAELAELGEMPGSAPQAGDDPHEWRSIPPKRPADVTPEKSLWDSFEVQAINGLMTLAIEDIDALANAAFDRTGQCLNEALLEKATGHRVRVLQSAVAMMTAESPYALRETAGVN